MRFIKYLQEALTLKQVKEIKPAILSKKYKTYLNKVFKGEDRIYLDFDANKEDKIVEDSFFQGGSPGEKTGATRDYGFEEGNEVE